MLNTRQARDYIEQEHKISIQAGTVTKWLNSGQLEGKKRGKAWETTIEAIERAIEEETILRPVGRRARFSREDRLKMRDLYAKGQGKHTLKEIASIFGCSISYVSRVVKDLTRP